MPLIDFKSLFSGLISALTEREKDVLHQRYQLSNELKERATLKEIGDRYSITRERVRQIERDAINKLLNQKKEDAYRTQLQTLENALVEYLEKNGGLVDHNNLFSEFVAKNFDLSHYNENAYHFVFEQLFENVEKIENHDHFENIWIVKDFNVEGIASWLNNLKAKINELNALHEKEKVIALAREILTEQIKADLEKLLNKHSDSTLEKFIETYLRSSRHLDENILGQWGLSEWDSVNPRKLGDKIHLIFEQVKNPLHFRDIAQKINEAKFDHKNICPATVHNELIANDKYVLIGRGIYALKDWGFEEGTVADVVSRILQEAGKPLSKDEIIQRVMDRRKVNKSTIYLTLINKDKFNKSKEGFSLKK